MPVVRVNQRVLVERDFFNRGLHGWARIVRLAIGDLRLAAGDRRRNFFSRGLRFFVEHC